MPQTIFILGTDTEHCKQLRETLQERNPDAIVTTAAKSDLPRLKDSDIVVIASEEKNTGVLYRNLLGKMQGQVHRAQFLSELMRLFSSSLQIEEVLEKVVRKSTEVLGDTACIITKGESKLRIEAAHSTDNQRLVRMLMAALNGSLENAAGGLLGSVIEEGTSIVVENLHHTSAMPEIRRFIDEFGLISLIATPIRTKDGIIGAFLSLSAAPRMLGEEDLATAADLAEFTGLAVENARLVSELQRSAITDSLTGVYNTRFFNEVLNREAARAERYQSPLALLMIDVDGFKIVNDTYGHVVGNKVLTQLSRVLEHTVRNTDLVFRCGGDEFGVVLPGTTMIGAMRTADKILQKVQSSQILTSLGYNFPLTVSIGVSEYKTGTHFETLVAEADQALYASKRSSKNCVRAFSASV
jgi:diguanylate cyclase (GGDEF)-like protein